MKKILLTLFCLSLMSLPVLAQNGSKLAQNGSKGPMYRGGPAMKEHQKGPKGPMFRGGKKEMPSCNCEGKQKRERKGWNK